METLEAILTRRSVRSFTDQPVAAELVTELLRAAMQAPSAGNQQPWQLVVLDDRATLEHAAAAHPYAPMAAHAPVAVVVCGDTRLERHTGYWVQDCSAAVQNLLLAAHARGLGAVWTGIYPRTERVQAFQDLLRIPAEVIPLAMVVLGYPAHLAEPADRFLPERVHRNSW
jgi:nitroreductase